jgi:hypothetical protein
MRKTIAVKCRISRGGFSGERVVKVTASDGKDRIVLAPTHYCWNENREPLESDEPAAGEITGFVAAQEVSRAAGKVTVTTPDGEVFSVRPDDITDRPPNPEPEPHVPIGS